MAEPPILVFVFPGVPPAIRDGLKTAFAGSDVRVIEGVQLAPVADVGVFDLCEQRHPVTGGATGWQLLRSTGARCRRVVTLGGGVTPPDIAPRAHALAADASPGEVAAVVARLAGELREPASRVA